MLFKNLAIMAAAAGSALAQRPANISICDYYTTALLMNNTAANQYTLLTLLVNTAVIGNYTTPNVGVKVNGILNPGTYMGKSVNLLPYFDGGLASTSDLNTSLPVAVNFLDGGGAAPLLKNMPSDSMNNAQYFLLTHLYQYFGSLLGCSGYGTAAFPAYAGRASMTTVHRYMNLDSYEVGYFISQVGASAESFGVAAADVTAVGDALTKLFDYKCAGASTVIAAQGPQLNSICLNDECPAAPNATCAAYPTITEPLVANASLADGEGMNASSSAVMSATVVAGSTSVMASATGVASYSGSATTTGVASYTGAAVAKVVEYGAVVGAAALFAIAL